MNRRKLGIVAAMAVLIVLTVGGVLWQRAKSHSGGTHVEAGQTSFYTCPMHPTVRSDKPGSCPICGMTLVKKTGPAQAGAAMQIADSAKLAPGAAVVTLSPSQRALANVKTARVTVTTSAAWHR